MGAQSNRLADRPQKYLDGGIKISTIATDLEQRAQREGAGGPSGTVIKDTKGSIRLPVFSARSDAP
jgi:hypothetical protein